MDLQRDPPGATNTGVRGSFCIYGSKIYISHPNVQKDKRPDSVSLESGRFSSCSGGHDPALGVTFPTTFGQLCGSPRPTR